MADIRFYDLDFNLLYILPQYAEDFGYQSINTQQDFNDNGSVEIVFRDEELKGIAEQYRDNILVTWNGFQGFLTSYKWTDSECRLFGMHLNGLLHRIVIGITSETTDTAENIARAVFENIDWLTLGEMAGDTKEVTYSTDKPKTADTFIQELFKAGDCGYCVTANLLEKKYVLDIINTRTNPLMLSVSNLNAYGVEVTYNGKAIAHGGWYKKDDAWLYVSKDTTRTGIHNVDTVLSAGTNAEALNELKACKEEYEVIANVRNIEYGADYAIGDIVRVQTDGITQRQLVSGVSRWQEKGYGEKPILTDFTEVTE
ncbi:MAG: hypothetical protein IJ366_09470 [Clostridia bacterium]|nr:hypothetical protein [Clostridia bacterium]